MRSASKRFVAVGTLFTWNSTRRQTWAAFNWTIGGDCAGREGPAMTPKATRTPRGSTARRIANLKLITVVIIKRISGLRGRSGHARADWVAVAEDVVHAAHVRPEFVVAQALGRERRRFARIGFRPQQLPVGGRGGFRLRTAVRFEIPAA